MRRAIRHYLQYLDRHGSVAQRLVDADLPVWVVFGDRDDVGLTDEERAVLDGAPSVHLVTVPDAGHMALVEQPRAVAEVVHAAVAAVASA
jgi:pimeloyl-ACP methyl ester carboxylesterase